MVPLPFYERKDLAGNSTASLLITPESRETPEVISSPAEVSTENFPPRKVSEHWQLGCVSVATTSGWPTNQDSPFLEGQVSTPIV